MSIYSVGSYFCFLKHLQQPGLLYLFSSVFFWLSMGFHVRTNNLLIVKHVVFLRHGSKPCWSNSCWYQAFTQYNWVPDYAWKSSSQPFGFACFKLRKLQFIVHQSHGWPSNLVEPTSGATVEAGQWMVAIFYVSIHESDHFFGPLPSFHCNPASCFFSGTKFVNFTGCPFPQSPHVPHQVLKPTVGLIE